MQNLKLIIMPCENIKIGGKIMDPKVSIIIPVYNGENSISISLDSLLTQSYSNFEVLIIDDGSKDKTESVVKKYTKDGRFKYFFQENRGVSAARNKGLELARGEYVCFLDSDDFYEKTYIEKMLKKIEKQLADICYCGYYIVTPSKKYKKRTRFKSGDILLDYILGRIAVHTTGWFIKKSLLDKYFIKFPEGISWGEDFEFFCEVLARTKNVTFVDEYLTNYTVNFYANRLSDFSLDKLEKDYLTVMRIKNNSIINKDSKIEKALINYRLKALLVYRLMRAFEMGIDEFIIKSYFNKYSSYIIKGYYWNNGIRSIKLIYYTHKLKSKLKNNMV